MTTDLKEQLPGFQRTSELVKKANCLVLEVVGAKGYATTTSVLNNDFIHRDEYVLKVKDKSYGKALKEFAKKAGTLKWSVLLADKITTVRS